MIEPGAHFFTGGTYLKKSIFRGAPALEYLCGTLLGLAETYQWELQAWAVFPNHYHFVALSPAQPASLVPFIRHFHSITAIEANRWHATPGCKVWFQYWETTLTYPKSYFARLSYVHRNAVHHNVVREPSLYPWCSAAWLERRADTSFHKRIMQMKINRVSVEDDFEVAPCDI
ncbi:MAG: transposase [Terriglobia bacterium]